MSKKKENETLPDENKVSPVLENEPVAPDVSRQFSVADRHMLMTLSTNTAILLRTVALLLQKTVHEQQLQGSISEISSCIDNTNQAQNWLLNTAK